jgi:hypothetical protein
MLVLAAGALIILLRPKDCLTEEAISLWSETTIVDRLRLGHLTIGPGENLLWGGEADP